jgi:hypothetical protein
MADGSGAVQGGAAARAQVIARVTNTVVATLARGLSAGLTPGRRWMFANGSARWREVKRGAGADGLHER